MTQKHVELRGMLVYVLLLMFLASLLVPILFMSIVSSPSYIIWLIALLVGIIILVAY